MCIQFRDIKGHEIDAPDSDCTTRQAGTVTDLLFTKVHMDVQLRGKEGMSTVVWVRREPYKLRCLATSKMHNAAF